MPMSIKPRCEYDVLIVGAGPAGSSAAIRLAQSGLKVLVVEQKKFPRAKLCGEFISPECLTHFAELKVLDEMSMTGVALDRTIFYALNGRSVTVPSNYLAENSYAVGLSRAEMDNQLLDRARLVGADILEETTAAGLLFENKKVRGVRLRGKDRESFEVNAALTIDATGRARILAREIEREKLDQKRTRADFVAFKAHLRRAHIPKGVCEIYAYGGGYGGCSSVEDGLYNLCFIVSAEMARKYNTNAAEIVNNVVCANQRAAQALQNAAFVDDWLAVPIENYGKASLAPADGLLTIGDAAAFIDPFTGSGMLLALESAKVATNVITANFASHTPFSELVKEYQQQYSRKFDRRLRISSFVRQVAFVPFLAETVIKILSVSETLTHRLAKATRSA